VRSAGRADGIASVRFSGLLAAKFSTKYAPYGSRSCRITPIHRRSRRQRGSCRRAEPPVDTQGAASILEGPQRITPANGTPGVTNATNFRPYNLPGEAINDQTGQVEGPGVLHGLRQPGSAHPDQRLVERRRPAIPGLGGRQQCRQRGPAYQNLHQRAVRDLVRRPAVGPARGWN